MSVTVLNPATEEPIAELEQAGVDETDAAVARAEAAYPGLARGRARRPGPAAAAARDAGRGARRGARAIESRNVGKPIAGARGEVAMVAEVFHFYAGAVDKHHGETIPVAGGVDLTFREPLGVVGLIVPWNFPLNIASWKLGPALACGNTVVLKPAELTPLSALRLAELALEAGIPEGVVNVVAGGLGRRAAAGRAPRRRQDRLHRLDRGRPEVMQGAAGTIKRVTLELGGKSANVVFADADLERAAAAAPYAVFDNAGQDCCARSRILVERSAYDRFVELLVDATRGVQRRRPGGRGDRDGPARSRRRTARRSRASSTATPRLPAATRPDGAGFWFPCTLVEATNDDRVAREEVFGPVAAVIPFDDEADAMRIANDTPYGLSGSIWTRDGARALRVARALETGRALGQLEQLRAGVDAVRRLQAVGLRPRAGHARRSTATRRSRTCSSRRRAEAMGRLDGKVCVITGAGGGMGREAASCSPSEGAQVCVADVDSARGRGDRALAPDERVRVQRGRR